MKLQVCYYKVTKDASWLRGIAALEVGFGTSAVDYILTQDGEKIPECWDYQLVDVHPGNTGYGYSVIDTDLFAMTPWTKDEPAYLFSKEKKKD